MANALALYLERHGLSQTEFARRAGLPAPQVCLWVNAKRKPGIDNACAIERATDGEVPVVSWGKVKRAPGKIHAIPIRTVTR